ncbi:dnaJ domain-containing protein [Artemisia annua]|uniref:DnaJ domain-containing protein n=1 Tax=Artemisia annua TaxID=35608 RepID=A0A2U1MY76_ARTAN|nr:dnaJ domain-containing protein [Artemisia annua]
MSGFIDHYSFLGLPSSEKGFKVSKEELTKAYRSKALELHPDKSLDDPNAVEDFQQLQESYKILKNKQTREAFHKELMFVLRTFPTTGILYSYE